ncbi:hypothetical protein GCM10011611_12270 [Aliidongia dinghuensis]|uniref:Lipoprotein n=1 Tax=Aliidongia dinghuensis TaxID=1867774 RepID=A0A8J2YRD8_9PROT|nr:hypothetical protein [Aliidongia dinghuensis]GGF08400.1 hypothetical protein GCM10011611_12270 [Aliidongia dinghuensis]
MKLLSLALAVAVTLGACSHSGLFALGTARTPALGANSDEATGAAEAGGSVTGTERGRTALPPYIVPAHPDALSGDDGGIAGKTNPD